MKLHNWYTKQEMHLVLTNAWYSVYVSEITATTMKPSIVSASLTRDPMCGAKVRDHLRVNDISYT